MTLATVNTCFINMNETAENMNTGEDNVKNGKSRREKYGLRSDSKVMQTAMFLERMSAQKETIAPRSSRGSNYFVYRKWFAGVGHLRRVNPGESPEDEDKPDTTESASKTTPRSPSAPLEGVDSPTQHAARDVMSRTKVDRVVKINRPKKFKALLEVYLPPRNRICISTSNLTCRLKTMDLTTWKDDSPNNKMLCNNNTDNNNANNNNNNNDKITIIDSDFEELKPEINGPIGSLPQIRFTVDKEPHGNSYRSHSALCKGNLLLPGYGLCGASGSSRVTEKKSHGIGHLKYIKTPLPDDYFPDEIEWPELGMEK